MEGLHIFGVIKEFRSASNKIPVDYGKFIGWLNSKVKEKRKIDKLKQTDPR